VRVLRKLKIFLIELAMAWASERHSVKLKPEWKLPKMRYKGDKVMPQMLQLERKPVSLHSGLPGQGHQELYNFDIDSVSICTEVAQHALRSPLRSAFLDLTTSSRGIFLAWQLVEEVDGAVEEPAFPLVAEKKVAQRVSPPVLDPAAAPTAPWSAPRNPPESMAGRSEADLSGPEGVGGAPSTGRPQVKGTLCSFTSGILRHPRNDTD
jgi:hypothetical protein